MSDAELLQQFENKRKALYEQLRKRIVGQDDVIDALLVSIFAGGHALIIGAPGVAKTLLVRSLSEALGWHFNRIQFTPDLMPMDITGTDILQQNSDGERHLEFMPGPIFANLILADEINRTPPKTQAALLEAMEEKSVTAGGKTRKLERPFFVLATQNPIEQEGTYHLPEAQLDRFLLSIQVKYPNKDEELEVAMLDTQHRPDLDVVLSKDEFHQFRELIERIPVPPVAVNYAVELIRSSRPDEDATPWIRNHVAWGAGPRSCQHLIAAARALSALRGQAAVDVPAIRSVFVNVVSHRIVPNFQAASVGIKGTEICQHLIDKVKA